MRISLTGSSSTGKSTLAQDVLSAARPGGLITSFKESVGRPVLAAMGHRSIDGLTQERSALYQSLYLIQKCSSESTADGYITDRSFIDVAAYWLERDAIGCGDDFKGIILEACQRLTSFYDLHFYLPFGLIPFERDGQRADNEDFHRVIDERIRWLLEKWEVPHVSITVVDRKERVRLVLDAVNKLAERTDR
jgi:hypothetical protein